MRRVLVVDDEENIRLVLKTLLRRHGYEVEAAADVATAAGLIESFDPDVVLTDVRMPQQSGWDLLATLRKAGHPATVIVMSAFGNIDLAIEAIQRGAYDYISKPFRQDEVVLALRKAEERESLRKENRALKEAIRSQSKFESLLGASAGMQSVFKMVAKISAFKTTVLITGESGVGKELVARAVHARSPRHQAPFVAVNCGAIPGALLESELFGHRRGAFTDASADRRGLFEEAHGGTLFLDEIGELPLALQVKLLRALQEETIRRLGDTKDVQVDVRVIAATHRNVQAEVKAGRFREDLFYRLNVLSLHVPPLRDRKEDIPLLMEHFIQRNNVKFHMNIGGTTPEARRILMAYAWPGNVRELENTIERAMVLTESELISASDLPEKFQEEPDAVRTQLESGELSIKKTTRLLEETLIRRALKHTGGNRTKAAEILEISHRALLYKLKEYEIIDL